MEQDNKVTLSPRAQAFNAHFEWWKRANVAAITAVTNQQVRTELLLKGAAASAWNAALSWAAERIEEKK